MDIKEVIESAGAAVHTLKNLGYTYHGAEYWKPPIGEVKTIKLIDGKAYQFDYKQGVKVINNMSGICISSGDIFLTADGSFCISNCTNIKLLTVEVK